MFAWKPAVAKNTGKESLKLSRPSIRRAPTWAPARSATTNGRCDFSSCTFAKLKIQTVDETSPSAIDSFRATRRISALTWTKELQSLRGFFRFAMSRKWASENSAANVSMPKNLKPADKEPYSRNDVVKILAACDGIGHYPYERLRARAMVLLLRYTALRISEVATLAKDRVRNGEVYRPTMKNGKVVKLPAPAELVKALDVVPVPRGASGACRYFFRSGNGTTRAAVRDATRTLAAVFKASGGGRRRSRASLPATRWLRNCSKPEARSKT
jgi:integrase